MSPGARAWRNRVASLGLAAAAVLVAARLEPQPQPRGVLLYTLVVLLGYGHLLGAAWFPSGGHARPGARAALLRCAGLLAAFAVYAGALQAFPPLLLALLAVSTWHTVENDFTLAATCARRAGAAPLPRSWEPHLLALGGTALLLGLFATAGAGTALASASASDALAQVTAAPWRGLAGAAAVALAVLSPRRRAPAAVLAAAAALLPATGLGFPEAFALFGLYHLLSWLLLLLERGHGRRLLAVHALPAGVCAGLLALPGEGVAGLRAVVLSPALYLFWSVLHVGQTALARGRRGS